MSAPPVINEEPVELKKRPERARKKNSAWWWLFGLVGAAIVSRMIIQWNVAMPVCGFRSLTTFPCPLCGGTRTMKSIAKLDLVSAAQLNPLVFLVALLIVAWAILRAMDGLLRTSVTTTLSRQIQKLPVMLIALGLILINWAYLIWSLP